jgi:hypothetical protein
VDPPADDASKPRDCHAEKVIYDKCFRNWYRYNYLRKDFEDPCEGYFDTYNTCLVSSLRRRGLADLVDFENSIWKYDNQ